MGQPFFQQKSAKIRESVKPAVKTNIVVAEFYPECDIGIGCASNQIIERNGTAVFSFNLYRNQMLGIANEKVHFQLSILFFVVIKWQSAFYQGFGNDVFIYRTFVNSEVTVSPQVIAAFLIQRGHQQAVVVKV